MTNIAYLGLGVMGSGMVSNLLRGGHAVTVWNRSVGKAHSLLEMGATLARTPAEAVENAEVIFYCLSDDAAVHDLLVGSGALLDAVQPGQVAIDMTTLHPDTSRWEASEYKTRGVEFLDAPVFGSKNEAANAGLWIVVGGERALYDRMQPLLTLLSETTHYMGETGMGASMKLVGNLLVAFQLEAIGEALILATKAGLNVQDVLDVIHVTDFKSPIFDGVGSGLRARNFDTFFALKLLLKDANLISRFAQDLNAPTPALAVIREMIKGGVNRGWGEENASAFIRNLEEQAGVTIGQNA